MKRIAFIASLFGLSPLLRPQTIGMQCPFGHKITSLPIYPVVLANLDANGTAVMDGTAYQIYCCQQCGCICQPLAVTGVAK